MNKHGGVLIYIFIFTSHHDCLPIASGSFQSTVFIVKASKD